MFYDRENNVNIPIGMKMPSAYPGNKVTIDPTVTGTTATQVEAAIAELNSNLTNIDVSSAFTTASSGTNLGNILAKKYGNIVVFKMSVTLTGYYGDAIYIDTSIIGTINAWTINGFYTNSAGLRTAGGVSLHNDNYLYPTAQSTSDSNKEWIISGTLIVD